MKLYTVAYRRLYADGVHYVEVRAHNKYEAYTKAVYDERLMLEGMPYSAWVTGAICKNGKVQVFNTHEGMPY
jgi:hypothetical protein